MRTLTTVIWAALAAGTVIYAQDPPGRVGRLSFTQGLVSFQPAGVDDWVDATVNRPLTTGDQLWVDQNGRAEIQIGSAGLRLGPNTAFEFLNLDDLTAQIRLTSGAIEIHLRSLDENQSFEVDTPNLAFSLLRPGVYRIDARPDQQTTIATVRAGEGEGTGGGQAFPLRPREQARVTGLDFIQVNTVAAPGPDAFDGWCELRNRREQQAQAARFVSPYVIGYEDLDAAGDWRPVPEYGNVWFPRGVAANWAPYRYGHWSWVDPWGWTWVDDAAWGFAPFHYGRWARISNSWAWVPGPPAVRPTYAPALVAFVGGFSAGIAWFPLGPREVYVPSYHVSENYVTRVNVSNTVVNNITVVNVYKQTNVTNIRYVNQSVPAAVTAVPREAFSSARRVDKTMVTVQAEEIVKFKVVRTAEVAPTRASAMGRGQTAAASARPPAAIVARAVVTKATPPPAPVAFVRRQEALKEHPGQPLDQTQLKTLRAQSPPPPNPRVRPVAAMAKPVPQETSPAKPVPHQEVVRPAQPPTAAKPVPHPETVRPENKPVPTPKEHVQKAVPPPPVRHETAAPRNEHAAPKPKEPPKEHKETTEHKEKPGEKP